MIPDPSISRALQQREWEDDDVERPDPDVRRGALTVYLEFDYDGHNGVDVRDALSHAADELERDIERIDAGRYYIRAGRVSRGDLEDLQR